MPRRTAIVRENLRLAFGEVDERLVRAVYRHFFAAMVDLVFYRRVVDFERFGEHFRFEGGGVEHLLTTKPPSAILVTGHFGNWELLAAATVRNGVPLAPVARQSRENWFARRLDRFRRRSGQTPLDKDKALPLALKGLRAGKNIAFLMDQSAGAHGIEAPFFGRPVQTFSGPAALAIKLGVPIYACYSTRLGPGLRYRCWVEHIEPVGDAESLTARINEVLEKYVRACPEQWWWFHRRFKPTHYNLYGVPWSRAGIPLSDHLELGRCRGLLAALREAGPHFNALVVEPDGLGDPERREARTRYLESRFADARGAVALLRRASEEAGHARARAGASLMDEHLDGVEAALGAADVEQYEAAACELPRRLVRMGHALLLEEAEGRDDSIVAATLRSLRRHHRLRRRLTLDAARALPD